MTTATLDTFMGERGFFRCDLAGGCESYAMQITEGGATVERTVHIQKANDPTPPDTLDDAVVMWVESADGQTVADGRYDSVRDALIDIIGAE